MAKQPPRPKFRQYQPDQICFALTYDKASSAEERRRQYDRLLGEANSYVEGARLVLRNEQDILEFPPAPDERPRLQPPNYQPQEAEEQPAIPRQENPFSLVFAHVEGLDDDPASLVSLVTTLQERIGRAQVGALNVEAITLNWLSSTSPPDPIGVGGPGARPVLFRGNPALYESNPPSFSHLPEPVMGKTRGNGVKVAILDTAHCAHDLEVAYQVWRGRHSLVDRLLAPNAGRLRVQRASPEDLARLSYYALNEHPYQMADHGLFAAGIINTIAPEAELILIEVLNSYGIGDLQSIGRGMQWLIANTSPDDRVVVNCSFCLSLPLESGHKGHANLRVPHNKAAWLEEQARPLQLVCDRLYEQGRQVVAAAGNERRNGKRPRARFPAAFDSAVGVGALPKGLPLPGPGDQLPVTSYSNLSDRPQHEGIATLGGEEGETSGILGIYIGDFPKQRFSPGGHTGWAWWAGTSFATPILSGVVAAVLGANPGFTTQQALSTLYLSGAIPHDVKTQDMEDVLFVSQDT